jgi:antitoxin component HigA of HigAB toxin-antitoxin module
MNLMTEDEYRQGLLRIQILLQLNDPQDTVEIQALADRLVAYEEHHFPLDTPSHLNADAL